MTAMTTDKNFLNNPVFWEAVEETWAELEENRGNRAELRRAKTPTEVFVSAAYQRGFVRRLYAKGIVLDVHALQRLALPMGVLAHAKRLARGSHFARQLAQAGSGSQQVHDVRFRRLLAVQDRDDLYLMLIRLLRYLGGEADPESLVKGGYWWNDNTRRQWAAYYYGAEPATATKEG